MKKYLLLFGALGNIALGAEYLGLPSPELQKGASGISISTNYKSINSKKSIVDPIKDIYRLTANNNEILFENFPQEVLNNYFVNVNVGNLHDKSVNSPNISLLTGYSLDDNNIVGLAIAYNNFTGKYESGKTKGNGYQMNLLYKSQKGFETLTTTLYVGSLNEKVKKLNEKIDNTYWGLHSRYEFLEEDYNLLYKGYRIDLEGKQLRQKQKSIKTVNDSVRASIKGILKKDIEIMDNNMVTFEVLGGYEHEFMGERVYKKIMSDDFKNSLSAEAKVGYKINEQVNTYVSVEYKKSLNTSNKETTVNLGIRYTF